MCLVRFNSLIDSEICVLFEFLCAGCEWTKSIYHQVFPTPYSHLQHVVHTSIRKLMQLHTFSNASVYGNAFGLRQFLPRNMVDFFIRCAFLVLLLFNTRKCENVYLWVFWVYSVFKIHG